MQFRQDSGEITPTAWLGGAVTAVTLGGVALLFERWVGSSPVFIVFVCGCALAALCLFGAERQHYINVGRERERAITPPVAPPLPVTTPPPTVSFVTCKVDVQLMHRGGDFGGYKRLPADGNLVSGVVAAFRHRSGPNAVVTAHIRYVRDGEVVHAHAGAWVGGSGSSFTLGSSHVGELVLAVDSAQVYCYAPDVVANGVTLKKLPYGRWVAEVELDIRYGESVRYVFDLVLLKNHSEMRASLRPDPHP